MLFDSHTHFAAAPGHDRHDPRAWLANWAKYGVTHGAVCPLVGLLRDDQIRADNDDIAAACARSGGRMVPLCTVNPNAGSEAAAELDRCLRSLKVRGVKFHPWLQGASASTPTMDQLCDLAGQSGVPVMFHDGTPPYSLPSQVAMLARRHPRTMFMLGHTGIFEYWREAIESVRCAENLWTCLCSPHPAAIRQIVARCGCERLVWGSDHGFGPPERVGYHLHTLDHAGLTDAQREAILSDNPRRLFGLAG
jgi:uncharacterized protein